MIPLHGQRENEHSFSVDGTFGEDVYVAVCKNGQYIAGWPDKNDIKHLDMIRDHLERHRDFYNDKQLLGVVKVKNKNEILSLVNLRRRHAKTHFGEIGGEWDKEL